MPTSTADLTPHPPALEDTRPSNTESDIVKRLMQLSDSIEHGEATAEEVEALVKEGVARLAEAHRRIEAAHQRIEEAHRR
ncbi:hypothetical protein HK104_005399, partial [Borealophlyctis nickersoniae]